MGFFFKKKYPKDNEKRCCVRIDVEDFQTKWPRAEQAVIFLASLYGYDSVVFVKDSQPCTETVLWDCRGETLTDKTRAYWIFGQGLQHGAA